ncbi:hypothetical protein IAD21_01997 [Abditibacteriota bacterium]|nr:hypothetical protein IAD21_01997 [Abditibacteriota bacterium]
MAHLSPDSAVGIARLISVKGEPSHFYGLKLTPPR